MLEMVEKFREQTRRIFFDNFFTSIPLCQDLLNMGLTSIGTLRANKREIPVDFLLPKKPKESQKVREIGSCLQAYHGSMLLTSWIAKKGRNVLLLSSHPEAIETDLDPIEKPTQNAKPQKKSLTPHTRQTDKSNTTKSKRKDQELLEKSEQKTRKSKNPPTNRPTRQRNKIKKTALKRKVSKLFATVKLDALSAK